MKKPLLYLLAAYLILLLLVPGYLICRHYNTLVTGEDYKFIVRPYDPYDPFRGRYVALQTEQSLFGNQTYAMLERDALGYATIAGWSDSKPQGEAYVKNLQLDRYYMNERMAPEAERIQFNLAESDQLYLMVKVKNGAYVIQGLYFNDIPIEQYISDKERG